MMKLKSYGEGMADFRTALWVGFWLYILQAGEPSLLGAVIGWIGRQ
jgi:hypothetical protein